MIYSTVHFTTINSRLVSLLLGITVAYRPPIIAITSTTKLITAVTITTER